MTKFLIYIFLFFCHLIVVGQNFNRNLLKKNNIKEIRRYSFNSLPDSARKETEIYYINRDGLVDKEIKVLHYGDSINETVDTSSVTYSTFTDFYKLLSHKVFVKGELESFSNYTWTGTNRAVAINAYKGQVETETHTLKRKGKVDRVQIYSGDTLKRFYVYKIKRTKFIIKTPLYKLTERLDKYGNIVSAKVVYPKTKFSNGKRKKSSKEFYYTKYIFNSEHLYTRKEETRPNRSGKQRTQTWTFEYFKN